MTIFHFFRRMSLLLALFTPFATIQAETTLLTLRGEPEGRSLEGRTWSQVMKEHVLQPVLAQVEEDMPPPPPASLSAFDELGLLSSPLQRPRPLEFWFSLPGRLDVEQQIDSAVSALISVLAGYRGFVSYGGDL